MDDPKPAPGSLTLTGQQARHVTRVLRMKAGQALTVFDGVGNAFPATIEQVTGNKVELCVGNGEVLNRESALQLSLAMALVRGERMDLVIQKATELGATEIVPISCARSVVQLDSNRAVKRQQHWRRVAISACEQCGRNNLPVIQPVTDLSGWLGGLERIAPDELRVLADPKAGRQFDSEQAPIKRLKLLIGPEGGFTEAEVKLAEDNDFRPVIFGPRILRAETAAVSLLAVVQWQFGDLCRP